MTISSFPVLYSFRRCPYAMRARLALLSAGIVCELREVQLKLKPEALRRASQKATVPVLVTAQGEVIDESVDIMQWALEQNDPQGLRYQVEEIADHATVKLCDIEFKPVLDRYKYADRYPEKTADEYRAKGAEFLKSLDAMLKDRHFLIGAHVSAVDYAVFPFIRQFVMVDLGWFESTDFKCLKGWVMRLMQCEEFGKVMRKYKVWQPEDTPVYFP